MDRVFAAKISHAIPSCIHVDAASVANFFWESSQNAFGSEDYINCAPPWKTFALHFPHPKIVISNNGDAQLDALMWQRFLAWMGSQKSYAFVFTEYGRPGEKWGMMMFVFADSLPHPGEEKIMPIAMGQVALESDGTISKDHSVATFPEAFRALAQAHGQEIIDHSSIPGKDQIARPLILSHPLVRQTIGGLESANPGKGIGNLFLGGLNVMADLACLAITFLHCKNVDLTDTVCPPAVPKKGKKYRNRVNEKKIDTFKILEISPFRRSATSQNGGVDPGLKKALHICRGHFKTYTLEKPLLGRHTGTFWFPQHVKGNPEQGTVTKDYRVGPLKQ